MSKREQVWAVAVSHHLTSVLEYYCGDFEAFCDSIEGNSEDCIVSAIMALADRRQ